MVTVVSKVYAKFKYYLVGSRALGDSYFRTSLDFHKLLPLPIILQRKKLLRIKLSDVDGSVLVVVVVGSWVVATNFGSFLLRIPFRGTRIKRKKTKNI